MKRMCEEIQENVEENDSQQNRIPKNAVNWGAKGKQIDADEIKRRIRDRNYSRIIEKCNNEALSPSSLLSFGPNLRKDRQSSNPRGSSSLRLPKDSISGPTNATSSGMPADNKYESNYYESFETKQSHHLKHLIVDEPNATVKGFNSSQWSRLTDVLSPRLAAYNRHREL